jgi:lipoprotein-anchoring transpeptidase ErfK/SrfK
MKPPLGALALLSVSFGIAPASADVVVNVYISSQTMTVEVDGNQLYEWPVSTARPGWETPIGTFRPERLARVWHSTLYHHAPMPYSVFFSGNFAIHGTYEARRIGRPVSHGCVRLLTRDAAILFGLVRSYGFDQSQIVIQD